MFRGIVEGKEDYDTLALFLKQINEIVKAGHLPDGTQINATGGGELQFVKVFKM